MAQYCDSNRLERHWFHWLLSTSVPALEPFREAGLLWTKIPGFEANPELADPRTPELEHCIALGTPHHLNSSDGDIDPDCMAWHRGEGCKVPLPLELLSLEANDPLLRLDEPFFQQGVVVPTLRATGYKLEMPTRLSWEAMIEDVSLICGGVARKFNPPSEEERDNLAHEALSQVMAKLALRKLTYTPGRAPVFNLLTTTVHRCMYSIKNRDTKQRKNTTKLASDLRAGILPRSLRSLRVPGQPAIRARG